MPFRALLAYLAVRRVNELRIPGDIVEAGVWHGGISCLMARAHLRNPTVDRRVWLFDTFEGMPEPERSDGPKARYLYDKYKNGTITGLGCRVEDGRWCYGSLPTVQRVMNSTGLPEDRVRFVKGLVESTLHPSSSASLPEQVAILRLDTDFYASTQAEMDVLWPRLTPGGWLFIDDYFDFQGCRSAVDTWLRQNRWKSESWRALDRRQASRSFHFWKGVPFDAARPFGRNPLIWRRTAANLNQNTLPGHGGERGSSMNETQGTTQPPVGAAATLRSLYAVM